MEYKQTYFKKVVSASLEDAIIHCIVPINNFSRYRRRYELFNNFLEEFKGYQGAKLYIVEVAFGNRPFECTTPNNSSHLQLRTSCELWLKENSIRLAIERLLPRNWEYACWLDADISFQNKNWAIETLHQLQHYSVIQPFQNVINLGPSGEVLTTFHSFGYNYSRGIKMDIKGTYSLFSHPGFALAMTRDSYNSVGGILDFGILGSGDCHMIWAFIDRVLDTVPDNIHPNYKKLLELFQRRCSKVRHNISYTNGSIIHNFHSSFKKRYYQERWGILTSCNFDPINDMYKNENGLWTLDNTSNNYINLRNGLQKYFRSRQEDSIDVDEDIIPDFKKLTIPNN